MKLENYQRIWSRRMRTPCKPSAKVIYNEVQTKSQAGIEYTHYKPQVIKI